MKIAIDISQIIYGTGVSRYTENLISELLSIDHQNTYLLFGGALRRRRELNLWLNRLPQNAIKKTFLIPPKLTHTLWNTLHLLPIEKLIGSVDIVHTSDWAEPPSKSSLKVTTIHDLAFFKDPQYASPQIRQVHRKRLFWVAKESDRIIAVSQSTKEDIIKYLNIDPDKIDVVYEGPTLQKTIDPPTSKTAAFYKKIGITQKYFLVPGSGHPRKNITRIVSAFNQAKIKDTQLAIIGRPTQDELKLQSSQVIFTDFIDSRDLPILFRFAEGLIYPSLYEGFGLPILDAFVSDIPVLTSNCSSMAEIAGSAAILVDPHNTEEISAGFNRLITDRSHLISQGQERLQFFSWKKTAKETLNIYKHLYQQNK